MEPERWDGIAERSRERYARLRECLAGYPSLLVAYSGGCDSAFLLAVAKDVLGDRAVALTAVSESLAPGEREAARALAARLGVVQVEVESRELDDPRYAANPVNRCYFCKSELFELAHAEAARRGIARVAAGANADELGDYRPGQQAAGEQDVASPLADAGMTKEDIRAWSRRLDLPTWDKPQTPCLSSRFPYGTPVTRERLAQVGRAEQAVREAGIRVFRVRHHDTIARVEIAADELEKVLDPAVRERVLRGVLEAGYRFAVVDLEPFRSGRLNEAAGLVSLGAPGRQG